MFTGNAISIQLPDKIDEKGRPHKCCTITFPDWIHKVYVSSEGDNNTTMDVRGSDLQKGMVLDVQGLCAIIVDINKEQLYHGIAQPVIQLGAPGKDSVTNKTFKRKFYEDGRIEWQLESESKFEKKNREPDEFGGPEIS